MAEMDPRYTPAEEEQLNILYAQLEPDARLMYVNFFLARTPQPLQDGMKDLIEANLPNPPDAPARRAAGLPDSYEPPA